MITIKQYFLNPTTGEEREHLPEHEIAAGRMLEKVNALLDEYDSALASEQFARARELDPDTGTEISGSRGGTGDGGFRLHNAKTGATNSKHKLAHAVDVYDPRNEFDKWLDQWEVSGGRNSKLREYGLHREHPSATNGWCHLQDLPPGSGKQTFNP